MATAAPRGALKSKQLYPGFLRGVREKCACLPLFKRESIASLFSPLALQLCGKERRHSLSLLFDYLCPLLCSVSAARLLFHGLHKSWTSASSFRVNVVF